jgi:hypothetical protein
MNIDEELRAALRREPAPKEFAAAVLAKTRGRVGTEVHRGIWQRPFTLALAVAVAAVAMVPAVILDYQRREAKGLKAKQDLLTALAITRDQLRHARERVQHTPRDIQ